MTPLLRSVILAALTASSIPGVAAAQNASPDSLLRRIDLLERRTMDLERRVRELEAVIVIEPSRSLPIEASPQWRDLRNWRQLRLNMTMDQVRAFLGEPERVEAGHWTFWYWGEPGTASVRFLGSSGKVEGWSEPRR